MESRKDENSLKGWLRSQVEIDASAKSVQKVLEAIRKHLDMDVAFVSQFREHDRVFEYVDAKGRSPVVGGDSLPMTDGYCQRVVDGRLPEMIRDAQRLPAAAALPETAAVPIGAHLSVPIYLSDGHLYGTFCCFSFSADESLTPRDLQVMRAFADLVADQIEREVQLSRRRSERLSYVTEAIAQGQPSLVYQPIFELSSGRVTGIEALSRFQTPPVRPPDAWFTEAASLGLGPDLEARAAAKALGSLQSLPRHLYVAINGSPDFAACGALERVLVDVDLSRVVLEITEHASVTDYSPLLQALAPLRAAGLRIAIDDTGAGYSSMRHILKIEPDLIKLDVSLTRDIDRDRKRRALSSALIAFAAETEIEIIAEGVESALELETLQTLGVAYGQGYFLARPVPLPQILQIETGQKTARWRTASPRPDPPSREDRASQSRR